MVCLDISVTLSLIVFGDGNNDVAEDDIEALNDAGAMKTSTLAKLKLSIMTCPAKR